VSRAPLKRQALALLRERGVPVSTVLDVGVLFGTPELVEAWPDVKHVLFEPVAEFADTIRRNYHAVDHELVSAAVSDTSGEVALETFSVIEGADISHSRMSKEADAAGLRRVPMVCLDDWLAASPQAEPNLLKIDIDGHEMKVLAGAAETLKRTSVVVIEASRGQFARRLGAVQKAGFILFDLTEPCYYDGAFWQCDAIFVREDLMPAHFRRLTNEDFDGGLYETFIG
jgi:FkbM family methyltransferase